MFDPSKKAGIADLFRNGIRSDRIGPDVDALVAGSCCG